MMFDRFRNHFKSCGKFHGGSLFSLADFSHLQGEFLEHSLLVGFVILVGYWHDVHTLSNRVEIYRMENERTLYQSTKCFALGWMRPNPLLNASQKRCFYGIQKIVRDAGEL